jgi:glycosyltransferase involved in cell wall biosynthesis
MNRTVLYVVPSGGLGGAETFLLQAATLHENFRPVFACLRPGPIVELLRARGATVHLCPSIPRLSRPIGYARAVRWIGLIARAERASLVHSTLAYGALLGGPAAKVVNLPHFWFQHGPVSGWQDWLAGKVPSKEIFVNSRFTAQKQRALGTNTELRQVRLGVEINQEVVALNRESCRASLQEKFSEKIDFLPAILCRPQPQKGVLLFLEALAKLRAGGIKAGGVLFGGAPDSPSRYESEITSLAQKLNIPFLHLKQSPHPWATLKGGDALVCASISPEGYGLTLAEANAYGVPAIAPREGGPLDLIRDGVNGLLYEPRSATDLARAMQEMAENPTLKRSLIAGGFSFAAAELTAGGAIRQIENVYQTHLGE